MKQVNSKMVADVITEIGVGSRFPHKSRKAKRTFYESVANELNYLINYPSDSIARLFGNYLTNNGIDVIKFNIVMEEKYQIGLFQDNLFHIEGLEDFSDRVTSQAKALCESRKVEDCKTSLGLELESVRSKEPIDLEEIQQLRTKIEKARSAQIEGLRDAIDSMQTLQIEAALSKFRFSPDRLKKGESPELSDKEIEDIINGKFFKGHSRLTVEDLLADDYSEGKVVYDRLKFLASMPRAIDLNDTEILQLAHCMSFEESRIVIDFDKLDDDKILGDSVSERLQCMQNMEGNLFYDIVQIQELEKLRSGKREDFGVYDRILLELEALENLAECQLFAEQVTELGDRYDIITDDRTKDEGFTKKEIKSLDTLRRIAGDKVRTLEKKGFNIYDVVWKNKKTEVKLLQRGKEQFTLKGEVFRDGIKSARKSGQEDLDKLRALQDDQEDEKE